MRGIEHLIPEAQEAAKELLKRCNKRGLNVLITDTLRTEAEQNALYAQGRTTKGNIVTSCRYPQSLHNWGCAFDFCRNEKGREYENSDGFFEKCGAVAEDLGLVWGGHFKKPDRPHIQLAEYAPDKTAKWLIQKYNGNPTMFIKEKTEETLMTTEELREMLYDAITSYMAMEIVQAGISKLAKEAADELWADEAMKWAEKNGIFKGDKHGNLMPKKPITREEAAQMLKNYDKWRNGSNGVK